MASTKTIRKRIKIMLEQQGGRCHYCGTEHIYLREDVTKEFYQGNRHLRATFDHVIPASKGGTYALQNGVCACSRCNGLRGNMPYSEFVYKLPQLLAANKMPRIGIKAKLIPLTPKEKKIRRKRRRMFLMNSYLVARYAVQAGRSVIELFDELVYNVCEETAS